jgi:cell division protein FtsA
MQILRYRTPAIPIGRETADGLFSGNITINASILPVGSEIITQGIHEQFSVAMKDAERIKIRFGTSISEDCGNESISTIPELRGRQQKEIHQQNLNEIIQEKAGEFIGFVHYEINSSGCGKKLHNGIVLTGGGVLMQQLCKLTEQRTKLENSMGIPVEHLADGSPDELSNPPVLYDSSSSQLLNLSAFIVRGK